MNTPEKHISKFKPGDWVRHVAASQVRCSKIKSVVADSDVYIPEMGLTFREHEVVLATKDEIIESFDYYLKYETHMKWAILHKAKDFIPKKHHCEFVGRALGNGHVWFERGGIFDFWGKLQSHG